MWTKINLFRILRRLYRFRYIMFCFRWGCLFRGRSCISKTNFCPIRPDLTKWGFKSMDCFFWLFLIFSNLKNNKNRNQRKVGLDWLIWSKTLINKLNKILMSFISWKGVQVSLWTKPNGYTINWKVTHSEYNKSVSLILILHLQFKRGMWNSLQIFYIRNMLKKSKKLWISKKGFSNCRKIPWILSINGCYSNEYSRKISTKIWNLPISTFLKCLGILTCCT